MNTKFRIADAIGYFVIAVLLSSLLSMSVARRRVAARRESCENRLKQIGLAFHNYHSAFKQLPRACGGTTSKESLKEWQYNQGRLSPFLGLMPFMDQQRLWEQIVNPYRDPKSGRTFPAMGPVPWFDPDQYAPWGQRPKSLVCPSDKQSSKFATVSSYMINYGDAVYMVGSPYDLDVSKNAISVQVTGRGVFIAGRTTKFRDILDGLSNTLMLSESRIAGPPVAKGISGLTTKPTLAIKNREGAEFWPVGRDATWTDGSLRSVGFQTILPPNAPSATRTEQDLEGVMPPSSYHPGGVHVMFSDGYTRFVTESIDVGDQSAEPVSGSNGKTRPGSRSPFGLWGAIGTRANRETLERENPEIVDPPKEYSELEKQSFSERPIQTWTAASGRGSIRARQIDLERDALVVLMDEQDNIRRIALSLLNSEDAYRAVQQHLKMRIDAVEALRKQLQLGVELLERRDFAKFAETMIEGGDAQPEIVGNLIKAERGLFIHRLETALRILEESPNPAAVMSEESGELSVKLPLQTRGYTTKMRMIFQSGQWQFSLR
ncbi:MAG: DUF1559 domain-containing protein [Planctomycetota bacterium]